MGGGMTQGNDPGFGARAQRRAALWLATLVGLLALAASDTIGSDALASKSPLQADKKKHLIAKGRSIFFNETFKGNGRTCGTCHRAEDNFGITPGFIITLPRNDPLFIAETNRNLAKNFENPRLMRELGLILENLDGFDDLANKFVMRGVPHVLALRTSVNSPQGPRTGWSGDGAPGDGSLRSFATGAVIQHFTKTLNRVPGVDFRLPTDNELDALNTPPLVEAADTGPFFHNNSVETIEGAVAFYTGAAFRNSPAGKVAGGIDLDGTQVVAVAAFLRVINALENIRQAVELLEQGRGQSDRLARATLGLAAKETGDAIKVLDGGGLHPRAVDFLRQAQRLAARAAQVGAQRRRLVRLAIEKQRMARAQLIEVGGGRRSG
jgi:hypothetical protein